MSFTDKPVRFLGKSKLGVGGIGYGGGIAESISPLVDYDVYRACYTLGALFVIAHFLVVMMDSGDAMQALDVLIFELIASALIPTVVAHFLLRLSIDVLNRFRVSDDVLDYAPTCICLLVLLAMCDPVDNFVNQFMDMSFRKVLK